MKITWLGHACFLFEQDGYRIVTDPYAGVEGYPDPHIAAHQVLCSHGHRDHSAVDLVSLLPAAPSPFSIREIETFHDDQRGALRGSNTVRIFSAGGKSAVHLGDLGHMLSPAQTEAIGPAGALLIPVGGYYTIDARTAKQVCEALKPRCIVPMHYSHPPYGLPAVSGVEEFLGLWPASQVHRLDGPALDLDAEPSGVAVLRYCGGNAMDV